MSDHLLPLLILTPVCALFAASAAAQEWTSTVAEMPYTMQDGSPAPDRNGKLAVGKDGKPVSYKLELLLPESVKVIRGILMGGKTWTSNDPVRAALAEERMGILYYGNPDGLFYYVTNRSGPRLERDLKALAEKSGHPEVAFAPWMTVGYSTSGITCRNVAYWNPDRVIGVMHMMSGNFQAHIQDIRASLAGVPFLVGNGEIGGPRPAGLATSPVAAPRVGPVAVRWDPPTELCLPTGGSAPVRLKIRNQGQTTLTAKWLADPPSGEISDDAKSRYRGGGMPGPVPAEE